MCVQQVEDSMEKIRELMSKQVAKVKDLWVKACQYDGIDPDSSFVVHSERNPYVDNHNIEFMKLMKMRKNIIEAIE